MAVQFPGNKTVPALVPVVAEPNSGLETDFQRMTFSLRTLSKSEIAQLVPLTVEVLDVRPGATTEVVGGRPAVCDLKVERFRC